MKLLFINYEFPPLGGGGGNANAQIAREMAALGHEVVVMTSAFKGLPKLEKKDGYTIRRIPTLRRYQEKCRIYEMVVFMISSLFFGLRIARAFRPNTTISFFTIPSGPAAWLIHRIYKIPYVVSLRGGDVPGFMSKHLSFYHKLAAPFIRRIWKDASEVVANSSGLKELALKHEDERDIMMIPNGVDLAYFDPAKPGANTHPLIPRKEPILRLMTAGRLTAQKGIDTLLFAFWRLKPHLTKPVQLWIVGDGPLRQSLEELAQDLKLENDVFFLGWCQKDTMKDLYASADMFVLSSIDEGMPNVLLEAMAMGMPIITTNVPGSHELVENGLNGFVVPAKHPEEMAQAMLQLINEDSLRRSFSQASLKKAKHFDWKSVAQNYIDLCSVL